jgi:SPP1 family phage portal protein
MRYSTMIVNNEFIRDLMKSREEHHQSLTKRWNYYLGKNSIHQNKRKIRDMDKNSVPFNFLQYIIDTHTALNTSSPAQIVLKDNATESEALTNFENLSEQNNLETIDSNHFLNSLVFGYSIELHSVNDSGIKIRSYDPRQWYLVEDEKKNIHLAIHQAYLSKGTVYNSEFLQEDLEVLTVYTSGMNQTFLKKKSSSEYMLFNQQETLFKDVPIVKFRINEKTEPFISDALMMQNDSISKIINARLDEVEYVNAILAAIGFQVSEENQNKVGEVLQDGSVILPPDSDLKWIQKTNDSSKYNDAITDAREFLFLHGKLPDRKDVKGSLSTLSGEAIKFLYQPTLQQAEFFLRYFKLGLKDRIRLINYVWNLLDYPVLTNYTINMNVSLPVDFKSLSDTAKNLQGIISHKKQLELIPGIDPEQELYRIESEQKAITEEPTLKKPEQKEENIQVSKETFAQKLNRFLSVDEESE